MDNRDLIKAILAYTNMPQNELAAELCRQESSLSRSIANDTFTTKELQKIADIVGAEYTSTFSFRDGKNSVLTI